MKNTCFTVGNICTFVEKYALFRTDDMSSSFRYIKNDDFDIVFTNNK